MKATIMAFTLFAALPALLMGLQQHGRRPGGRGSDR